MLPCIKYLVILYDFILLLFGTGILALAIFFYLDTLKYIDPSSASWPIYSTLFMILIAIGMLVAIVGFLGCCGAIKQSTCMLGMYLIICVITLGVCGAAFYWAGESTLPVKDHLKQDLRRIIQKFYRKHNSTGVTNMIIDKIQTDFQCCGSTNYTDWSNSWQNNSTGRPDIGVNGIGDLTYYQGASRRSYVSRQEQLGGNDQAEIVSTSFRVPVSCCSNRAKDTNQYQQCRRAIERYDAYRDEQFQQVIHPLPGVNSAGCVDKIHSYLLAHYQTLLIAVAVCIGIQFLVIVFTCILWGAINSAHKADEEKRLS